MRQWQVRDVMSTDVVATHVDSSAQEALEILDARHVSAMPVVDSEDRVVGVVSRTDLLPRLRSKGPDAHPSIGDVEELMTVPAWTVAPETTLSVAAKQLQTRKIKRLPVTGDAGRLVGILSATDLLRVFARLDNDIHHDVVQEVLHTTKWIDGEPVHVVVRDGVVTLAGVVDRRSTTIIAERLAYTVPGVVSVINRLDFDYDDTAAIRGRTQEAPPITAASDTLEWSTTWASARRTVSGSRRVA